MSFTTQTFIFVFFPLCLGTYYLCEIMEKIQSFGSLIKKIRIKDIILICFSFGFYMWVCFDDIFRFFFYIVGIFILGKMIEKKRNKRLTFLVENTETLIYKKEYKSTSMAMPVVVISILGILFCLVYFKYTHILADVWNFLFKRDIEPNSYLAPLGISFISFSSISYVIDIYRGDEEAGSFLDCALYLSFFPKVVSGPVVLWKDFGKQILNRSWSLDKCVISINRIMIGFAKKLILADQLGSFIGKIPLFEGSMDPITTLSVMFAYMLQIYFDFSGYSDIAIGLAGLFGFNFKENFNFPYCSTSISEFWRRWHISLGTWFKEYVYIPLGGSRNGQKRTILNQAIVFILTGLWHGAGYMYLLWGSLNGIFVIFEKLVSNKKIYINTPKFIKWLCTMGITFVAWQLFRLPNLYTLKVSIGNLLGLYSLDELSYTWEYYIHIRIVLLMIIGTIGSTILSSNKLKSLYQKFVNTNIGFVVQEVVLIGLFIGTILCMVNSTYSPFIYFQY